MERFEWCELMCERKDILTSPWSRMTKKRVQMAVAANNIMSIYVKICYIYIYIIYLFVSYIYIYIYILIFQVLQRSLFGGKTSAIAAAKATVEKCVAVVQVSR